MASLTSSRTDTRTSGTTADDFDLLSLSRTNVQNGAGGTTTAAGSVLRIENVATQTAGTLTDTVALLELVQDPDSTGAVLKATDGTNTTLEARNLSTNFGLAANAGAFIDRNSYFGWEFTNDAADITAQTSSNSTSNDLASLNHAGYYETGTSGCTFSIVNDTPSGILRMAAGAASNGCLTMTDAGANDISGILDADNLPVILMKVKPSQADTNSAIYTGMAGNNAATINAPTNLIGFSNDNNGTLGTSWIGTTRSAGTSTYVDCSVTVSTTQFALLMVEVRSTSNVRFFVDGDVSDGISFTECGSGSSSNIPTIALAAQIYWAERSGGSASNLEVDFFRVWQDDAPESQVAAAIEAEKVEAEFNSQSSLAQFFPVDDTSLAPGTLVSLGTDGVKAVPSAKSYDAALLGVIADAGNAGLTLGANGTFDGLRVATHGRTRVRVSAQNGPIEVGNYITSSSTLGIAMKANHAGQVLGMALEPHSSGSKDGFILVEINPGWRSGGTLSEFAKLNESGNFEIADESIDISQLLVDGKAFLEHDTRLTALTSRLNTLEGKVEGLQAGSSTSTDTPGVSGTDSPGVGEGAVAQLGSSSVEAEPNSEPGSESGSIISDELTFENILHFQNNVEVLGELEVHADVTLYANLIVDTVHIAQALNVHGDTNLFGNLTVGGTADFQSEVSLSSQQLGRATIPRGGSEVEVVYTKPFLNEPVVQISASDTSVAYRVSGQSKDGFTIVLAGLAQAEITFNWTALSTPEVTPTLGEAQDSNGDGVLDIDEPAVNTPDVSRSDSSGVAEPGSSEPAATPGESPAVTLTGPPAELVGESANPSPTPEPTPNPVVLLP